MWEHAGSSLYLSPTRSSLRSHSKVGPAQGQPHRRAVSTKRRADGPRHSGLWAQQAVAISDNQSTWRFVGLEGPPAHPACEPALGPGAPCLSPHALLCSPQFSPQVYQNLYFNELAPTHQPDFMIHKVIDQHGRLIRMVTHNVSKDLHPSKETASLHTNISSPSSLFSSASGSGFMASRFASPGLQSSSALQRP